MPKSEVFNEACMKVMARFPDKFFDLAVVDPPYGGGCSNSVNVERERELHGGYGEWDSKPRGRFGGRFDRYHIGNANRRDVGGEVSGEYP